MRPRWVDAAAWRLAVALAGLLARTWRYRVSGSEHFEGMRRSGRSFLFALWHREILPLLWLHRGEGVVILVSRHRDGGRLADVAAAWGYRPVRGSSQRGGEVGLLGIVRALQQGEVVAVTPDGPRGPAGRVKPGVVAAAQHAATVIVPAVAEPARAWRLRSWDRFGIPRPFTRIDVRYGAPLSVSPGKAGLRGGITDLEEALGQLHRMPAP